MPNNCCTNDVKPEDSVSEVSSSSHASSGMRASARAPGLASQCKGAGACEPVQGRRGLRASARAPGLAAAALVQRQNYERMSYR